jgi:hypothetical protein
MKGVINVEYPESLSNTLRLQRKDFAIVFSELAF